MRFQAIFRQNEQPVIVGCTKESKKVKWNSSSEDESSCHEFKMSEIEGLTKDMQDEVPLVAYKCPDSLLYGPASCKISKSIMYTCSRFKCRIYCPCKICRCSKPLIVRKLTPHVVIVQVASWILLIILDFIKRCTCSASFVETLPCVFQFLLTWLLFRMDAMHLM